MYRFVGVTNRHLCNGDYYEQIKRITDKLPLDALIVREKDLSEEEYYSIAGKVMDICADANVKCILHSFCNVAQRLSCEYIHLPLHILSKNPRLKNQFVEIGVSTHSVDDAVEAQRLGAAYITAGHIFSTDCKKGIPPRGLDFLQNVCKSVNIPVYAIGGLTEEKIPIVIENGAAGACIMSGIMRY